MFLITTRGEDFTSLHTHVVFKNEKKIFFVFKLFKCTPISELITLSFLVALLETYFIRNKIGCNDWL